MDLLNLFAELTFDSIEYETGVHKAEQTAKQADKTISASFNDASKSAEKSGNSIGTSMAGGVKNVASGIATATKNVATAAKNMTTTVVNATEKMVNGTISATSKVATAVANVGKIAASVATVGLGAASAATVKLGKDAFDAYGEYEQLAGGIDTLFGENGTASKAVKAYADNAFKTVQMSANDYMQTVTDFSASLLQNLDADTAADKADQALRQIADNSNKMGTVMSSVTDAYKGFAKDNFTLLDNLKLGYGGTAGEMARLINDSGVMNGEIEATAENVKDIPFDKIIDAIGVIQERLGMAGVSQEEALHTLQGSINMTKAAWTNLITGWANPDADLDKLVTDLLDSVDAVQDNALPAIERILNSMSAAVTKAAPNITKRLTTLISKTAPSLMKAASSLLGTLGTVVLDALPNIVDSAFTAITDLIQNTNGDSIVTAAISTIKSITDTISHNLPSILDAVFAGIKNNAPEIRGGITYVVSMLLSTFERVLNSEDLSYIVRLLTDTAIDVVELMAEHAPEIITALYTVWKTVITTALERVKDDPEGFTNAVREILGAVVSCLADIATTIVPTVGEVITSLFAQGVGAIDSSTLGSQIQTTFSNLFGVELSAETIASFCTNVVTTLTNALAPAVEYGLPAIANFITALCAEFTNEENSAKLGEAGTTIFGAVCNAIGTIAENGDVSSFMTSVTQAVVNICEWLTAEEQLNKMREAGTKLLDDLGAGIATNTPTLATGAAQCIQNIIDDLTSDYNASRLFDSLLAFVANIAIGVINAATSLLSGFMEDFFGGFLSPFMSDDELKSWKKDWESAAEGIQLDTVTGDDFFQMFRWVDHEQGRMSDLDYEAALSSVNMRDLSYEQKNGRSYTAWGGGGSNYYDTPSQINHTTELNIDGYRIGEANDVINLDEYDKRGW